MKKNKGITLISLIVTIIILLILAGISIASLTGSGLFSKAQQAKQEQENAQIKEEGILADYEDIINGYLSGTSREDGAISTEQYEDLIDEIEGLKTTTSVLATKLQSNEEKISTLESQLSYTGQRVNLMSTNKVVDLPTTYTETNYGDIVLSDSIENYRWLEIQLDVYTTDFNDYVDDATLIFSTEQLTKEYSNTNNINKNLFNLTSNYSTAMISCWFKDNKTLHIGAAWTEQYWVTKLRIVRIYGLK